MEVSRHVDLPASYEEAGKLIPETKDFDLTDIDDLLQLTAEHEARYGAVTDEQSDIEKRVGDLEEKIEDMTSAISEILDVVNDIRSALSRKYKKLKHKIEKREEKEDSNGTDNEESY